MKKSNLVVIFHAISTFIITTGFAQNPSPKLLTPTNHTLVMIVLQSQMTFATKSISTEELRNNPGLEVGIAKTFNVPTAVTTAAEKSFYGPVIPERKEFFAKATSGYIHRTNMNAWEDAKAYKAIVGREKKIVFAGL